jgi:hypothetical protein
MAYNIRLAETLGLSKSEIAALKTLSSPVRIQDFLDRIPVNHEKRGDTHQSPQRTLKSKKAHCFEGALLAALALWLHGKKPLVLHLKAKAHDDDHIIALYRENGYWGAISKTNHATLRFRDPVYKTVRELALSYFHEYFINATGEKTLVGFSRPIDLRRFGRSWITAQDELFSMDYQMMDMPHTPFIPKKNLRLIRKADQFERKAGKSVEWKVSHPRT